MTLNGWLNFDKPLGMTSAQAVGYIKKTLDIKKVGHGGTLDPLATGVLPIALGDATKTTQFLLDADKVYTFELTFGSSTTTDDAEGEVLKSSAKRPKKAQLEQALHMFTGEIQQLPPTFSALKIQGQRAYDLARKGKEVKLQPRTVTIHKLELTEFTGDTALLQATVSKGTYIRSLARDIGEFLGCYAHITLLRRDKAGQFALVGSITQEKLDEFMNTGQSPATLVTPISVVLADIPDYVATAAEIRTLHTGGEIYRYHLPEGRRKVTSKSGELVSLINIDADGKFNIIRNFINTN